MGMFNTYAAVSDLPEGLEGIWMFGDISFLCYNAASEEVVPMTQSGSFSYTRESPTPSPFGDKAPTFPKHTYLEVSKFLLNSHPLHL